MSEKQRCLATTETKNDLGTIHLGQCIRDAVYEVTYIDSISGKLKETNLCKHHLAGYKRRLDGFKKRIGFDSQLTAKEI